MGGAASGDGSGRIAGIVVGVLLALALLALLLWCCCVQRKKKGGAVLTGLGGGAQVRRSPLAALVASLRELFSRKPRAPAADPSARTALMENPLAKKRMAERALAKAEAGKGEKEEEAELGEVRTPKPDDAGDGAEPVGHVVLPKVDSQRANFNPSRAAKMSAAIKGQDEALDQLASQLNDLPDAVGEAKGAPSKDAAGTAVNPLAAAAAALKMAETEAPPAAVAEGEKAAAAAEALGSAPTENEFEIIDDGARTPDGLAPHTPEELSDAEGGAQKKKGEGGEGEGGGEGPEKRPSVDDAGSDKGDGDDPVKSMWKRLEKKNAGKALMPQPLKKADEIGVRFFGTQQFTKVPAAFALHKESRKKELQRRGFEERISKKTGRLFYYEVATGKSHWTLPLEAPGAAAQGALPPGYEMRTSKSYGKPYYVNKATGEVLWKLPQAAGGGGGGGGGGGSGGAAAAPPKLSAEELKARGLELRHSKKHGKEYYFEIATGKSHWKLPE